MNFCFSLLTFCINYWVFESLTLSRLLMFWGNQNLNIKYFDEKNNNQISIARFKKAAFYRHNFHIFDEEIIFFCWKMTLNLINMFSFDLLSRGSKHFQFTQRPQQLTVSWKNSKDEFEIKSWWNLKRFFLKSSEPRSTFCTLWFDEKSRE